MSYGRRDRAVHSAVVFIPSRVRRAYSVAGASPLIRGNRNSTPAGLAGQKERL